VHRNERKRLRHRSTTQYADVISILKICRPFRADAYWDVFPAVETLTFIHKSISAAKLLYREAVRDHSPGLLGLGFCQREFALKGRAECDDLSTWIARYSFASVPVGRPFRADFDGVFPGLKAWAVLLNRFAVRSNRLVFKDQG